MNFLIKSFLLAVGDVTFYTSHFYLRVKLSRFISFRLLKQSYMQPAYVYPFIWSAIEFRVA